jgi:hypothetical protein
MPCCGRAQPAYSAIGNAGALDVEISLPARRMVAGKGCGRHRRTVFLGKDAGVHCAMRASTGHASHEAHVLLARVAEEVRQQPLAFEISVTNVDKHNCANPPMADGDRRQHRVRI